MAEQTSGHRSVPHTADLRIEAWAPTRDGCIREAVLGTVASFLDSSSAQPRHTRLRRLTADRDDDLLVAVLDEVIYLLDTEGEAPVDVDLNGADGAVDVNFAMVDANNAASGRCRAEGGVAQRSSLLARPAWLAVRGDA